MPGTNLIEQERPSKDNVKKGDLVFVLTFDGKIVSGQVSSVCPSEVGVRSSGCHDIVPYANLAF